MRINRCLMRYVVSKVRRRRALRLYKLSQMELSLCHGVSEFYKCVQNPLMLFKAGE